MDHRVARACERSADIIDAGATRLETNLAIGPEVDLRTGESIASRAGSELDLPAWSHLVMTAEL